MTKTVIVPKGSAPPLAPYSPAIKAGNVVYVSGTVAIDGSGRTIGAGDVRAQTRAVLDAIADVLEAAGGTLSSVTFNTIILKDFSDYAAMNEVYATYFPAEPPARYCITAGLVRDDFLVEIASIAHI